jgi:hypothetical protein
VLEAKKAISWQVSANSVPGKVRGHFTSVRGFLGGARLCGEFSAEEKYTGADFWVVRGFSGEVRGYSGSLHKNSPKQ